MSDFHTLRINYEMPEAGGLTGDWLRLEQPEEKDPPAGGFLGWLQLAKGYPWDGSTGALNTRDFVKASCVHDIFCEMINAGLLPLYVQALADEEMRLIEKEQEMPWLRRMWTFMLVRFYQINKKPGYQRPVYEVP